LADRMHSFEEVVARETVHLESLWKEWHETHLELVFLAVEVLGPDGADLALKEGDNNVAAKKQTAIDGSRELEANRAEVNERVAELEASIRTTAEETINDLTEQEKVRWSSKYTFLQRTNV
jgi:hypothetical protein